MRIALIDGEHYPDVNRWALEKLNVECAVFIGGMEKIGSIEDVERALNVKLYHDKDPFKALEKALEENDVEEVIDLSDEPVMTPELRFRIASYLLKRGIAYKGADFEFRPKEWIKLEVPSINIIGTGKRVGKTAIGGFVGRTLKERYRIVIVTMGRGGPEKPEIIRGDKITITPEFLVKIAEQGRHAASDHFEDALTAGVPTIGCRRCGGGLAGFTFLDVVKEGIEVAKTLKPELIVLEGSGASFANVLSDGFITVVSALQGERIKTYMYPLRISLADIVVVTMVEEVSEGEKIKRIIKEINPDADVHLTRFAPRLIGNVEGKAIVLTTSQESAKKMAKELERKGIEIAGYSGNLANRGRLREEMNRFNYDTVIVELKAGAVDVAIREALSNGKKVVFLDNEPVNVDGKNLKSAIKKLAERILHDKGG
ncbi:P-loop NTPase family protein [Pyrococcus abyssi]|uniref:Cyclic 2,3-diphosphoglycerate synthetase n=1 Tax=Pyrococcus abyssi (strain GE5 / Orsay) TaxID=272844 RepID=CPGS_PYRAB|nr:2,3-diphosphoglycerate synthetase [Pyrococcus abyssi]Q9V2C5.2 RecName: Full=Cyclic 2,3-diphosphoglycerate synthetase; Short=cDPGS [Pyrococcus abyssi GE5]CCE69525.1 TPA: Cyclic 2,3-diphosphoglycerate synthase [Pyrococcus abyssi GE5]